MEHSNEFLATVDDFKNTRLHQLAMAGEEKALEEIPHGMKVDPCNEFGWTPLMVAARKGHLNCVKILTSKRADSTKENIFGGSVFMCAVASGNLEMVRYILHFLLVGGVSRNSIEMVFSPVSLAILFDHEDVFRYLLDNQFKPFFLNSPGVSPMMFAALNENPAFWKELKRRLQHSEPAETSCCRNKRAKLSNPLLNKYFIDTAQNHQSGMIAPASLSLQIPSFGSVMAPSAAVDTTSDFLMTMPTNSMALQPTSPFLAPYYSPLTRTSSNVLTPATIFSPVEISPIMPLHGFYFPSDYSGNVQFMNSIMHAMPTYHAVENNVIESPLDDEVFSYNF